MRTKTGGPLERPAPPEPASLEFLISPIDLVARADVRALGDDLDAERWLDEGGSFSKESRAR